jgi:CRISPR/Cas system-associated exonuclease Cas4 (RecB family)
MTSSAISPLPPQEVEAPSEGSAGTAPPERPDATMTRTLYLSYSAYKQYHNCPREYYFSRVQKLVPDVKDSKHNAIMGTVIQAAFEKYYNERLWEGLPLDVVAEELQDFARLRFFQFLEEEYVNWRSPTCRTSAAEIQGEMSVAIPHVLRYLHEAGLHGPMTASEVDFKTPLTDNLSLVGYVDFIIRQDDGKVLILDGKATKDKSRVDPDQLRYYALMFFLRYHVLPDALGFLYYRFCDPEARDRPDQPDPRNQGPIEWVPVDLSELMALRQSLLETADKIRDLDRTGVPPVNPTPKICNYCQWEHLCPERRAQREANAAKRAGGKKEDVEESFGIISQVMAGAQPSDSGLEEVGFTAPTTARGRMARSNPPVASTEPAPADSQQGGNPLDFFNLGDPSQ